MMTLSNGQAEPLLRCNSCNRRILSAESACVIYRQGMQESESSYVSLVHKGPCQCEYEAQMENEAGKPVVMQLTDYLLRFTSCVAGHEYPAAVLAD